MNPLERLFPALQQNAYQVTSPIDTAYNCIAWAAGDNERWWWPDLAGEDFWPDRAPREETVTAFVSAFQSLGYLPCDAEALEAGREKIALFAKSGSPTHAARQLPSGRWTSRMGRSEDIEHALRDLEGDSYGMVAIILFRVIAEEP